VYHRAEELRPSTLLDVLERIDAFRRPERLEQYLLACEADSRGRPGFEDQHFAQPGIFRQAYHAAMQVGAREVMEKGFSGKQVGEEMHRLRVEAIKAVLTQDGEPEASTEDSDDNS